MELSELHDCEKSHGKIVAIEADLWGITKCGYCHEVVDYYSFYKQKLTDRFGENYEINQMDKQ